MEQIYDELDHFRWLVEHGYAIGLKEIEFMERLVREAEINDV